ncbi:MAG: S-layer homology domain-containing protein, partial [Muribaculaceae bacterium]|nr:S-layer homology domain-containing protein [Muribaculaceae bacterium]
TNEVENATDNYFHVTGNVQKRNGNGGTGVAGTKAEFFEMPKSNTSGFSFTVTNAPARLTVAWGTPKDSQSATLAICKGNKVLSTETKGGKSFSTTLELAEGGEYLVTSASDSPYSARVFSITVSEAEVEEPTCTHANVTETPAVAATCAAEGNIQYWTCGDCGKMFSDAACTTVVTKVTLDKVAHSYGAWVADENNHTRTCSVCTEQESVAHDWDVTTESTDASCTVAGSVKTTKTCKVCSFKTESSETGVTLPHTLTATAAKAATCVATGNDAYWTCSVCGSDFGDAEGKTAFTGSKVIAVNADNHVNVKLVGDKAATTTEDGYTGDRVCQDCNTTVEKGEAIPALTGPMSKLLKGSDQNTNATLKAIADGGVDLSKNGKNNDGGTAWGGSVTTKMGGNDTVKDFFTIYYSAASKVDTITAKTWDVDGSYYRVGDAEEDAETRFNLGGKVKLTVKSGAVTSVEQAIGFTTTKPATVKIWWLQGGGDTVAEDGTVTAGTVRQIALYGTTDKNAKWTSSAPSGSVKNAPMYSEVTNLAAGTYYLGGVENNCIFMVEVIEEGDNARSWPKTAEPEPPVHEHEYTTYVDNGDGTHSGKCACGEVSTEKVAHVYGEDNKCVCGAVKAVEPQPPVHEHEYTDYVDNGDGTHSGKCACGEVSTEKVAHVYGEDNKCVCGAVKAVEPEPPVHEHEYTTYVDNGDGTHSQKCACGEVSAEKVAHVYGEDNKCVCGAVKSVEPQPPVHEHEYTTYVDNGDGTHSGKCACGEVSTEKVAHSYGEDDKCVCGATKPASTTPSTPSGGHSYRPVSSTKPAEEDIGDTETPLAGGPELNTEDHMAYITGYTDGTVGAEKNITREETAAIFYRLLTEQSKAVYGADENDFEDVSAEHWANTEISTLVKAGILKGLPDGSFGGTQNITRAEFVTIAARFFAVDVAGVNPFEDVNGHWAENEIVFAYSKGWVNGLPDGSFGPDKLITRAEAMRIINNVLGRGVDAEGVTGDIVKFSDVSEDAWYYYDVVEATNGHAYEYVGKSLVETWVEK